MRLLYLIDASVYIFRAWFSIDPSLVDEAGNPANAVDGYGNFLLDFLQDADPGHALSAFDASLTTCFRNELYAPYKANRPPAPPDLVRQIRVCEALTRALGVTAVSSERYEADDLIGSAAERLRPAGFGMRFLTSDKDYAQLLEPGDRLVDSGGRRHLDCEGVRQSMGVRPDQVADFLGLAGDSVDNIPGVPGVGPKAARALLNAFGDLDGVYRCIDQVASLPMRGAARCRRLLVEHREMAYLSRELATIHRHVPLDTGTGALAIGGVDAGALDRLSLPARVRRRAGMLSEPPGGAHAVGVD